MNYELVINSHQSGGVDIALLRDRKLIELHHEKADQHFAVGDVYLGTVNKLMPGLNAAFVDVGHEKDAFLHYLDLGPQVKTQLKHIKALRSNPHTNVWPDPKQTEADIEKTGKINQVLQRMQQVVVQVTKEPISNKGPRLTSQLSLAGRYVVLMPFDGVVSISKKIIKNEERIRLKKLVHSIKPASFGVIVRTVAEGQSVEELENDLKELMKRWEHLCTQVKTAVPGQKILGESERTLTLVRDLLNEDFTGIHVNDQTLFNSLKSYIAKKSPELEKIVKLHNGKSSIFEHFGVDKQIKTSFGKEVNFMGGSYLIIEHTEALHVVDVNSGSIVGKDINQDENALKVNLEAAGEIARQLRLRDMGGIIVVDFIDQKSAANKRQVYERLKDEMQSDRAKHKILPMSPFGLIQITRQRVRPEMNVVTAEKCPTCDGTGEITNSIVIVDEIENRLKYLLHNMNMKGGITIEVHPYIHAFFTKGFLKSVRFSWLFKYKRWIKVIPVNALHFGQYRFLNKQGEEIQL
ncbi:MAG: Rne/Rng family ribonuclease [Bacteroidetes bacterium]|nr:MAG: Rne/Rng family ribonuclease [Bacteroidota bacterium]